MTQSRPILVAWVGLIASLSLRTFSAAAEPATRSFAAPLSGVLVDSEGRSASGVQVVAIAEGRCEDVVDGRINVDSDAQVSTTNASGRFVFSPTTQPIGSIVAVTSTGRAWAKPSAVSEHKPLKIVPFSYVEGLVRLRGDVAAGAKVKSWSWPTDDGSTGGQLGLVSMTAVADSNGHFRVPVIGGADDAVVGRVQEIGFAGDMPRYVQLHVASQTTIAKDVGGGGRLVNFVVISPKGYTLCPGRVILAPDVPKVDLTEPDWPAESVKWDKARQLAFADAWKNSDTGKTAQKKADAAYRDRNARNYYGNFSATGQVQLEDVLPGKYWLICRAEGIDGNGKRLKLNYDQQITIEPTSSEQPAALLQLGDLQTNFSRRLYPGDSAPNFDFSGLEGGRVRLADHHGKTVLVHFWATWCGPCRSATPDINALEHRFGSDPRFISIHVAEDETTAPVQRYVKAESIGGIQAWSGPAEANDVIKAYGAEAVPTMVLIDANGRVLLSTNDSSQLANAIEAALDRHEQK